MDSSSVSTDSHDLADTSTTTPQDDLVDTFTSEQPCEQNIEIALITLKRSLSLPSSNWMDVSGQPLMSVCLCKVSTLPAVSTQPIVIPHCLTINEDLMWSLYVHNRQVQPQNCQALQSVPQILTSASVNNLLQLLDRLHVQPGTHFISMFNAKKGKISTKWLLILISTLL